MDDAIHLVVSPATADLTGENEPVLTSCKVIKISATLIIFADASSPSMTETAMIDALFARLGPPQKQGAAVSR